ncbi:MAG: hypothetical protein Q4G03_11475 [Planctomycetia bacterium]|nr:hypothetical protein [Planctomycetia bacterium]
MKKKATSKISLGHRHYWTDTAGHAHRIVFDQRSLTRPRVTLITLGIATLFAALVGGALVVTNSPQPQGHTYYAEPNSRVEFVFQRVCPRVSDSPGTAIASGWNDEYFVSDRSGVTLFDADGEKLDFWRNPEEEAPTALAFVQDERSASNGLLLIAYSQKVLAQHFSLEQYIPVDTEARVSDDFETNNAVLRTSHNGALGNARLLLTAPDFDIRGLTCSAERLFVADYKTQRAWRYSLRRLEELAEDSDHTLAPECELGAPDEGENYPGLRPSLPRHFCLDYLPERNELYVANSGLYRVDAFNAGSGLWVAERSWSKSPDTLNGFHGAANPVALVATSNWIATAETGKLTPEEQRASGGPFQLFAPDGSWLGSLDTAGQELGADNYVVGFSGSSDASFLYALLANGDVWIWRAK